MCGIAGFCSFEREFDGTESRSVAEKMGDTLRHRGPDDFGVYAGAHAAFAHARLAVIDIAGGVQPMTRSADGYTYTIVYNGELYNTPQLRSELTALGYSLTSKSDTEVLLYCYIHYGERCAEKLNGIFAFAVEDTRRGCLFLCRDRLGVKPLFYTLRENTLIFGSELKAVLAYPGVCTEADRDGLCQVLALGPARTPGNGVFRGVSELLPGEYGVFDPEGLRLCRYWKLLSHEHPDSYEKTVETVRDLLIDAIARQTVSDVPLCTFLSGGLDSSLITAVVSALHIRLGRGPLSTYSFDFTGNDSFFAPNAYQPDADRPWVDAVSRYLGTLHTYLECGNFELADALGPAVRHKDLPGMADVDASLYYFCRGVAQKHTVAISGECADEIFGGYPWFHHPEAYARDQFPWSPDVSAREALLTPEAREWLDLAGYAREQCAQSCGRTPRLEGENEEQARRREISLLNIDWFMATLLEGKDTKTNDRITDQTIQGLGMQPNHMSLGSD